MTARLPLRCPTCRQQVSTAANWWPLLPPHSRPGEAVCCPGVCTRGSIKAGKSWRPARESDRP